MLFTRKYLLFYFLLITAFISGCKSEDPQLPGNTDYTLVKVSFVPNINGKPFYMDSVYDSDTAQNYRFAYAIAKFYINHLKLNGSTIQEIKDVDLIDFGSNTPHRSFEAKLYNEGSYSGITLGIGLDSATNASDPAAYPATHPLSAIHGTHWGWVEMYRYIMVEGYIDSSKTGNFNLPFAVHTGFKNYHEISMSKSLTTRNGTEISLIFDVDLYKLLFNPASPTEFKKNSISHSDNALNALIGKNLSESITLR